MIVTWYCCYYILHRTCWCARDSVVTSTGIYVRSYNYSLFELTIVFSTDTSLDATDVLVSYDEVNLKQKSEVCKSRVCIYSCNWSWKAQISYRASLGLSGSGNIIYSRKNIPRCTDVVPPVSWLNAKNICCITLSVSLLLTAPSNAKTLQVI